MAAQFFIPQPNEVANSDAHVSELSALTPVPERNQFLLACEGLVSLGQQNISQAWLLHVALCSLRQGVEQAETNPENSALASRLAEESLKDFKDAPLPQDLPLQKVLLDLQSWLERSLKSLRNSLDAHAPEARMEASRSLSAAERLAIAAPQAILS